MTSRPRSKGFTLVELLVVMAIIGILVGMLLPAVQMVREAARRTSCLNNMKQLAIAAQNYQSAHLKYPAASDSRVAPNRGYSLHCYLLPYLEEGNIYDAFMLSLSNGADDRGALSAGYMVDVFMCPSATQADYYRGHKDLNNADIAPALPGGGSNFSTHYLGVAGPVNLTNGANETYTPWSPTGGLVSRHGVFGAWTPGTGANLTVDASTAFVNQAPRTAAKTSVDIGDGMSNTFMFGETSRTRNTSPNVLHFPRRNGWAFGQNFGQLASARSVGPYRLNMPNIDGQGIAPNERPFNSNHPGGVNFSLCDGSNRYVSDTVDITVLQSFASMDLGDSTMGLE